MIFYRKPDKYIFIIQYPRNYVQLIIKHLKLCYVYLSLKLKMSSIFQTIALVY